jgi:hypothetical protein
LNEILQKPKSLEMSKIEESSINMQEESEEEQRVVTKPSLEKSKRRLRPSNFGSKAAKRIKKNKLLEQKKKRENKNIKIHPIKISKKNIGENIGKNVQGQTVTFSEFETLREKGTVEKSKGEISKILDLSSKPKGRKKRVKIGNGKMPIMSRLRMRSFGTSLLRKKFKGKKKVKGKSSKKDRREGEYLFTGVETNIQSGEGKVAMTFEEFNKRGF